MAKGSKKVGLVLAIIMTIISASLATALALFLMGVLETDPVKLVFEVKSESKVYDGTPLKASEYTLVEGELPSDVTVEANFVGEQTNAGTSASDMTVKILDSSNYDVSSKYSIRVQKGTLSVSKRSVDIVMPTQQVEYNGSTVEFTDYRIAEGSTTSLVPGHKVYGSSQGGLLEVGDKLPSDLMPLIFDVAGNDVTNNYEISFAMGNIEIIPRELAVRPVSYSKVYDGLPLTVNGVEYVAGSLVAGQYATYSINNDVDARCKLTDVGELETLVTDFRIFQRVNGAAVDVTSNYNVDKTETGALKITSRQLAIKPTSHTKTYDGMAVDVSVDYLVGTLAEGQYLDFKLTDGMNTLDSVKDVGEYTIGLTDVHVMQYALNGTPVDVTSNYNLTATITGEIKINARPLTITAKSETWQYDGKAHSLTSDTKPLSSSGLVGGDSVISVTYDGEINGVGEVDNEIVNVTLSCPSTNYNMNLVNGTLKIVPCEIIVKTETNEKYYDTQALTSSIEAITVERVKDGALGLPVSTHTVVLAEAGNGFPTITNAGSVQNRVALTIKDGETDVSSNYSITYDWGTLTVKKMPVIVTLATDSEVTFDGSSKRPSFEDSVTLSSITPECEQTLSEIFPKEEKLELISYVKNMVDAGEYSYSVAFKDNADALNFSLEVRNTGYFTISPMPITVTLKNYTDGDAIPYTMRAVTLDTSDAIESIQDSEHEDVTIIRKDDFTIVCDDDLTSVGSYSYNVKIKDRANPDNYDITAEDGTVEIVAATIVVTLKSYTDENAFSYTGSAIVPDMEDAILSISPADFLNKSDFVLDVEEPIIDAGDSYTYKVKIKDAELAQNVTFTSTAQNLTVKKADLVVTFKDITTVYNGEEYVLDPYIVLESVDGGTAPLSPSAITLKYYNAAAQNYRASAYTYSMSVTDELAKNYNIEIKNESGSKSTTWNGNQWASQSTGNQIAGVTIEKFKLYITADSLTFTYDGTPHTAPGFSYESLANPNHEIQLNGRPTEATTVSDSGENEQDYQITDKRGISVNATSYDVIKTNGYITVLPREITVTTATKSLTYNGAAQTAGTDEDVTADNLVSGHKLKVKTTSSLPRVTTVREGYVTNKLEVEIVGTSVSGDFTENYTITYVYGKINIEKRAVKITTGSQTKKYDGEELKLDTPTADDLVGGHQLEIVGAAPSITDAGQILNYFTCIIKSSGSDVTDNYDITYVYGWLKVEKLTVTITRSAPSDLTYNGAVQTPDIGELISIAAEETSGDVSSVLPKAEDFDIVFFNSASAAAIVLNADTYTYEISPKAYLDLSNFTLKYEDSGNTSIVVKPRDVKIELSNAFGLLTYNGKDQTPDIETVIASLTQDEGAGKLAKSDFVVNIVKQEGSEPSILMDAGNYTCTVALADDIIAGNYAISYEYNTNSRQIQVSKRTITITAKQVNRTYNGEVQTITPEEALNISPAEVWDYIPLSEIVISVTGEFKNANNYTYNVSFDNPNFTVNGGSTLSYSAYIGKLTVNVTHNMSDFVYDGKTHTLNAADILSFDSDLVTPSDVKIDITGSKVIKNVDTYNYTVTFNSADFGKNFTWKTGSDSGSFEITKYVVSGTLKDYEKVYDGQTFTVPENAVELDRTVDKTLLSGSFSISVTSSLTIKNAGDYTYTVSYSGADAGNFDMTAITGAIGNVTVKKLAVGVTLYNLGSFVYNGQVRTFNNAVAIALNTSLLSVNDFTIAYYTTGGGSTTLQNAGEYLYGITYTGSADKNNFDLDLAEAARGMVTITPLPVTVTLKDYSKTFDNNTFSENASNFRADMTISTDLLQPTDFNFNSSSSVNVGKYSYTATYNKSGVPESNFVITYVGGNLTISPLDVTITLEDISNDTLVYNGTNHSERNYITFSNVISITSAPGISNPNANVFDLELPTELINAGTYTYRIRGINDSFRGANLENYNFVNIDSVFGTVTVKPMDVYLKFKQEQGRAYDGTPYTVYLNSQTVFDLVTTLDGDDTISKYDTLISGFKVAEGAPVMINADTYTYKVVYTGDDATNYNFVNIDSAEGTVKITPKTITVTLSDYTRTYDGQIFTVPVETAVKISSSDYALLLGYFRLSADVEEMKNVKRDSGNQEVQAYEYSVVYVGSDKGNFTFEYKGQTPGTDKGQVTIKPFGVAIQLADFIREYDGVEFNVPLASALNVNNTLMVGGWNVYVDGEETPGTNKILYAKTYTYLVKYSGEDAGNFDLSSVDRARGTVTIRPVSVTVTLPDIVKDYDGEAITNSFVSPSNIKYSSDLLYKFRDNLSIGTFEFKYAGEYSYVDKINFTTADENAIGSFHITYEGGNVTINAVHITVTLPDAAKTYDKVGVTIDKNKVYSNSELFNLEYLTIDIQGGTDNTTADYIDANQYNYFADGKVSYSYGVNLSVGNEEGAKTEELNNLKKSIIIEFLGGNIKIDPRPVTVTLKNYTKTYDGYDLTRNGFSLKDVLTTSYESLISSAMFDFSDDFKLADVKNAGEYTYSLKYTSDVPETNFLITYEGSGSIVITPYEITVELLPKIREYNGQTYSVDSSFYRYLYESKIQEADRTDVDLKVTYLGEEAENPGEYYFNAEFNFINSGKQDEINKNYILTVVGEGKVTITKYRLTISLNEIEETYTGEEIEIAKNRAINLPSNSGTGNVAINTNYLKIVTNKTVKNAGSYTYTVVVDGTYGYDDNASDFFELNIENEGHITVNKKTVTVELKTDLTGVYTGLPQYVTEGYATINDAVSATPVNESDFRVKYETVMVDAGKYKYTAELINTSLLENYDFIIGDGEYEITKAYIYITVNNFSFVYNGRAVSVDIGAAINVLNVVEENNYNSVRSDVEISKGDFMIVYNNYNNLTNAGNTSYSIEFASSAVARNFAFHVQSNRTGSINITRRLLSFVCADYVTYTKPAAGVPIDISSLVSLSSTLGDGDTISTITATGEFDNVTGIINGYVRVDGLNMENYEFANPSSTYDKAAEITCKVVVLGPEGLTFIVTLNPNYNGGATTQVYVEQGKTIYETLNGTDRAGEMTPTREGYDFLGWFTDAEEGDDNEFKLQETAITQAIILYAHWNRTSDTFTITFNYNNKDFEPDTTTAQLKIVEEGIEFTAPATEGKAPEGKVFEGWYTIGGILVGKTQQDLEDYFKKSENQNDCTLYAHWTDGDTD